MDADDGTDRCKLDPSGLGMAQERCVMWAFCFLHFYLDCRREPVYTLGNQEEKVAVSRGPETDLQRLMIRFALSPASRRLFRASWWLVIKQY
jgi:hypothetical protein